MRLDRILLDILAWIKARLYQQKASKQSPYEVLTRRRSPYGSLCLVERDTPRAIRTFVFMPFRGNGDDPEPQDVHIYLDTLTALEQAKSASQRAKLNHVNGKATHKITVVLADHWVSADGTYNADVLHEGFYDLQGRSSYEHRQAIATIDNLVTLLLHQHHSTIDWAFEIDASRKLHVPDSSGFTLLELIVAIVIAGVLATIISLVGFSVVRKAREVEGQQLVRNVIREQRLHFTQFRRFAERVSVPPTNRYQLEMNVEVDSVMIQAVPSDPQLRAFEGQLTVCDLQSANPELTLTEEGCR